MKILLCKHACFSSRLTEGFSFEEKKCCGASSFLTLAVFHEYIITPRVETKKSFIFLLSHPVWYVVKKPKEMTFKIYSICLPTFRYVSLCLFEIFRYFSLLVFCVKERKLFVFQTFCLVYSLLIFVSVYIFLIEIDIRQYKFSL